MEAGAVIQLKGGKAPKAGQETKGRVTSSKYAAPGIRRVWTRGRRVGGPGSLSAVTQRWMAP